MSWTDDVPHDTRFIHSQCCNAHWELVHNAAGYGLRCEKCGLGAGLLVIGDERPTGLRCHECDDAGHQAQEEETDRE